MDVEQGRRERVDEVGGLGEQREEAGACVGIVEEREDARVVELLDRRGERRGDGEVGGAAQVRLGGGRARGGFRPGQQHARGGGALLEVRRVEHGEEPLVQGP
jgi:hypothetical protein